MTNPYMTHMKVLETIASLRSTSIESAIEFGAGFYSTKIFLDENIFKDLRQLITFESDRKYTESKELCLSDERFHVWLCSEEDALKHLKILNDVDLIFVDGKSEHMRVKTALASKESANIVVVHDMENSYYKELLNEKYFKYQIIYNAEIPYTGIFTEDYDIYSELFDLLEMR